MSLRDETAGAVHMTTKACVPCVCMGVLYVILRLYKHSAVGKRPYAEDESRRKSILRYYFTSKTRTRHDQVDYSC